jgi:small conductance mechanosensitive channel
MWQEFVAQIQEWAPAVIACAVGVVLITITSRILRRRQAKRNEANSGILGPLLNSTLVGISLVTITLTLPIGEAAQGQLLGFLGLLVTAAVALSSTTILGNAMAGIMLRAIRSFRPGDFVRIGEHVGRVSDMGILHTEIQTEDRDLTTLPNLFLITHPLTVLRSSGTVVSATISLGYEISHDEIEAHLAEAARRAGLTDPFVQVVELGDFSITYRAAGFLLEIKQLLTTRSRLRKAMLDTLHEAKIEIVSPSFHNLRQVPEHKVILPRKARATSRHQEQDPEARIFDKADAAEAKSKMESEFEKCKIRLDELTAKISSSEFEAEKAELEHDLSVERGKLKSLETMIAADSDEPAQ